MKSFLILILVAASLNAFSQTSNQENDERELLQINKVAKDLAALDLRCESASDCTVLPLGKRACGGPSDYLITSTHHKLMNALVEVTQYSTVKESEYNDNYGTISICSILNPPLPKCVSNVCL